MAAVLRVVAAALLCAFALFFPPTAVAADTIRMPNFSAESVLLVDLDGRVIYAKNADNERAPASLVKLMTLYLACEDLDAGRADVEEIVTVSRHAATVGKYRMGLRTGEEVPLRVLLEGVAIASANDAASALARAVVPRRQEAAALRLRRDRTRAGGREAGAQSQVRPHAPRDGDAPLAGASGGHPRLRLRRVRDALRRALRGRGRTRVHGGSPRALRPLAPEAARVHVAPLAHGALRGLLGGDGGRVALQRQAPGPPGKRRGSGTADGRLQPARVLSRGARGARPPGGPAARDPVQRRAADARGGGDVERARRRARARHLRRPREGLQARARGVRPRPHDARSAGRRSAVRLVERVGRGGREGVRLPRGMVQPPRRAGGR